jgi:hypothetical protein
VPSGSVLIAAARRLKLAIMVTIVSAAGVGDVKPFDLFMKKAHAISKRPANTRQIQAMTNSEAGARPSWIFREIGAVPDNADI